MDPCFKARIQTAAARGLATIATGALAWFLALPIAQHFEYALVEPYRIGVGVLFALVALFVSKRALDFTQDCMTVPDAVTARTTASAVASCPKPNCRHHGDDGGGKEVKGNSVADPKTIQPVDTTAAKSTAVTSGPVSIAYHAEGAVTVVTVTATGITAAQFKCKNGLRAKLERVANIKWEHPKNLGNNTRRMIGRISDATRREQVLNELQSIARS